MTKREKMNTHKKAAIIVGVLFIIATAFLLIGEAFSKPVVDSADYLAKIYPKADQQFAKSR